MYKSTIIVLLTLIFSSGCSPLCGETNISTLESPQKAYTVIHYTRDCGATTAESSRIALIKGKNKIKHDFFVASRYYPGNIDIQWEKEDLLVINYHDDLKYLFMFKPSLQNIKIQLLHNGIPFTDDELKKLDILP